MKKLPLFVLLLCSLQLFACSKPNIEFGIASHPNINPDHSGRPSPIKIKMFELRNDVAFEHADFQILFASPIQALGADLLATDEFILIPGETRTIKYIPNPATRYIGVIAGFRQLDRSIWRVSHPVISEEENPIGLEISATSLLLIVGESLDDWSPNATLKSYNPNMLQQENADSVAPPSKMTSILNRVDTVNPHLPIEPFSLHQAWSPDPANLSPPNNLQKPPIEDYIGADFPQSTESNQLINISNSTADEAILANEMPLEIIITNEVTPPMNTPPTTPHLPQ